MIDPVFSDAAFVGGGRTDSGQYLKVDSAGNAYVVGMTNSVDLAGSAVNGGLRGQQDAFVTKINAAGTAILYSTYISGSGVDAAGSVSVDGQGAVYIAGLTNSTDFPVTSGGLQPLYGGGAFDGFVLKLAADGRNLVYSTYLGGRLEDVANDVGIDREGNAYVTGYTLSSNFPAVGTGSR